MTDTSSSPTAADFCAIDFGTSNSAIGIACAQQGMRLVPLEDGRLTMPTAVYYFAEGKHDAEGPPRAFGRAALQAYVAGHSGRLMRSMKSILGSELYEHSTDVGSGRGVRYADMLTGYLKQLKRRAEAVHGAPLTRAVLGRPVFFVDDDPVRDATAQQQLEDAARAAGFSELAFQFEPIAAAFDYERQVSAEQYVLVADIGGGTSDFSVVRVGPQRREQLQRREDILASHGVHIAGTDFDRHIELAAVLPALGYKALGPSGREVPSKIYFDLATWHLINTCYNPQRVLELRNMKSFYADVRQHARLMTLLSEQLGHELAQQAEDAKIASAQSAAEVPISLDLIESGLEVLLRPQQTEQALGADIARIATAAQECVRMAGLAPEQIGALYCTGGSTGLPALVQALHAPFPQARLVQGDAFASVAAGLALHAKRVFA
ncbi:Hsp70 family protein [Roseateles sp. BYS180W]|uniref:Hsp70 family protein n=1 Tax=Roseateles rivi TaxID=3299028 RepID=A0ABW7FTP2_9BURK